MNKEEERKLLEGYRRLSPISRHIALAQIMSGAEMEENARRMVQAAIEQGAGPEAPPLGARRGSTEPVLA
jgi:hypothetical protein